jgi:signal peptidase
VITSHATVAAAPRASSVDAATVADWSRIVAATLARGLVALLLGLAFWAAAPAVVGWQPTTVMTGSMMPRVAVGDVVIARPIEEARLAPGQVLLFDDPDREGALRLHRVDSTAPDGMLVTKGDANASADSSEVPPADVHGIGVLRVPYIGMPIVWLHDGDTAHAVLAGLAFLVLLSITLLDGPLRRRPDPDPADQAARRRGRHDGGGSADSGRPRTSPARGGAHRAGLALGRLLRIVPSGSHAEEARDRRSRTAPPRVPASDGAATRRLVLVQRRAARRRRRLLWGSGFSALVVATAGIGFVLPATAVAAPFLATTVNPPSTLSALTVATPTTLSCANLPNTTNGVVISYAHPGSVDSFDLIHTGSNGAVTLLASSPGTARTITFIAAGGLNLSLGAPYSLQVRANLGTAPNAWTQTSTATANISMSLLGAVRCR